MPTRKDHVDAIVIGSGISRLACAAALARFGKAVLVLERLHTPGGLTQTFSRYGFRWDVGLHYLGEMRQGGEARLSSTGMACGTNEKFRNGGGSIAEVVEFVVSDPRLLALLLAQKGDYSGMSVEQTRFGMHAVVIPII